MIDTREIRLGNVLNFYNGKAINVKSSGDIPVYGSNGVIGFTDSNLFKDGIIIGRVGAYCGATVYEKSEFWGTDNTIIVKAKEGFDNKYLSYLLQVIDLNWFAGGSAQPLITHGWIKPIKAKIPEFRYQQKIAAILSAYDDLIENNLQRIKLLEEMAQITYEEWFVRMKFPDHEHTPIDPETGLPEGWRKVSLKDVTKYINRGVAPKYVDNEGYLVINQKCIRNHRVDFLASRLTSSNHKIPEDKFVEPFDILVNSTGTGTLGRVAQLFDYSDKTTVDTHITIVRPSSDISPYILGRTLEILEPFLESLGKGATNQQELGRADLTNIVQINLPDSELMTKYDSMAQPVFNTVTNLRNENSLLKEARDILLPRLMTGMIDVDEIELPDVLLARMDAEESAA